VAVSRSDFDEQLSIYNADLAYASAGAEAALRDLFQLPVPSDVMRAEIEIFMDEYGGSPAVWIYFRGRNNRVDHSDTSIFPGRALELDLGLSGRCVVDEDLWEDFDAQNVLATTLANWLADRWSVAGGSVYAVPTQLSVHDGIGGLKPMKLSSDAV
jgi:hypothetical protein